MIKKMIGYHCEIELGAFLSFSDRDFPEVSYSQNAPWEIKAGRDYVPGCLCNLGKVLESVLRG